MQAATAIREAMVRDGVRGVHPDSGEEEIIDHVKLFVPLDGEHHGARALTLCPGTAYDRSPCGTGTSARMAQLAARGKLAKGERFVHESYIGSQFTGRIEDVTRVGDYPAIIPSIEGWARIYGENIITVDPQDDPYWQGFRVS